MKSFSGPGFTAEVSLGASSKQYRSQFAYGSNGPSLVQPQRFTLPKKGNCWCSEPDTKWVCTSPGVCHEMPICLQYACPGTSTTVDDPGDVFN